MPLFEFHCAKCESDFEELLPSAEAATDVVCPTCQSQRVAKKFSTFGVASAAPAKTCGGDDSPCRGCCHAGGACGLE